MACGDFLNPINGFNTQPPEGGWDLHRLFQTGIQVSTHSRLKAAGLLNVVGLSVLNVSTHSRLKAAVNFYSSLGDKVVVSTHSRLKAAAQASQ